MRNKLFFFTLLTVCVFATGCDDEDPRDRFTGNSDGGSSDSDADGDSDGDADYDGETGSIQGKVLSPSQNLPISGALVFLTKGEPKEIPDHVYRYECDEMGGLYTLSGADGTWRIDNAPTGTWNIITRKGNFRRVREIVVDGTEDQQIPQDITTLPGSEDAEGDTIPNFAVMHTTPDLIYNLLAKFGMGNVNNGALQYGTETFDIYLDGAAHAGYPTSDKLFETPEKIDEYHMIFFPCAADTRSVAFVKSHADAIRNYVSKGGKLYNSCCVALWTEAPFPDYIDFSGGNPDGVNKWDIGRISPTPYTTNGEVLDNQLSAWVSANSNNDPANIPFTMGYVKIDGVTEVDDGHGLSDDNGVVKPYVWVRDIQKYPGSPLMVTYNYDGGKVFYTVYETSKAGAGFTPQEAVLLYVILEVGVCENPPPI
ncbi:MAG: carboxypeptidase regulatory-like domain-containing protein [Deltaproteobacteria bacterium]|nr:carboxypeptidase regulatory-like domain-containing protein [Deltaproteobacteria bacterium]